MDSTTSTKDPAPTTFRTLVPARLDRLPWTSFHTVVLVGLGTSWFLNGVEIQLFSQGGVVLLGSGSLGLSTAQVALLPSLYLVGEMLGALVFARLADLFGRRKLFFVTLGVFIVGNLLSAIAPSFWFLLVFRFIAGFGVGGEQVAIVSAIDEMIPAKYRGRANIFIGATIWVGVMVGALAGFVFYNPEIFPPNVGWRVALCVGPVLCIGVMFLRRSIPESARWLMTHGHGAEAEKVTAGIEARVLSHGRTLDEVPADKAITIRTDPEKVTYWMALKVMFKRYPKRSFAALSVLTTQGFLYNAIFFTFSLVLANFYGIEPAALSYYIFIFGAGNALGALVGPLFDTVGRRLMMLVSYCGSGIVLAFTGWLFYINVLSALTITLLWLVTFFIASAGAGASYVVASEVFPVEMRAAALSLFFVVAQAVGATGPIIFGALIGDGTERGPLMVGYLVAAGMVALGGVIMWFFGIEAAGKSLEDVAAPLAEVHEPTAA